MQINCVQALSSELQFEFKRKRSTNVCMMVLKGTLSYYADNGGSVYCTYLDATKAFDKVDYFKLFKLLVDRMLPPVSVRLLLNMYTSHVCTLVMSVVSLGMEFARFPFLF